MVRGRSETPYSSRRNADVLEKEEVRKTGASCTGRGYPDLLPAFVRLPTGGCARQGRTGCGGAILQAIVASLDWLRGGSGRRQRISPESVRMVRP